MDNVQETLNNMATTGMWYARRVQEKFNNMTKSTSKSDERKMSNPDATVLSETLFTTMNSDKGQSLCDVTLMTSDGERIPAMRTVLAMSSPYFKTLLFSEFAEKEQSEITISITSGLLKQVIQFICTDDSHILQVVRDKMEKASIIDCTDVEELIELADVADYVQIERLLSRCEEAVKCVIRSRCIESPHLACMILRALAKGRSSWGKEVYIDALKRVQKNMDKSLFGEYGDCKEKFGVLHLDEQAAEDVFGVVKEKKEEQGKLFQALIIWACGGKLFVLGEDIKDEDDGRVRIETCGIKIIEDLKEAATRMATWFDVSLFKPVFLSTVVEGSGLVEYDIVHEAYKKQSLEFEKGHSDCEGQMATLLKAEFSRHQGQINYLKKRVATCQDEIDYLKKRVTKYEEKYGYLSIQ